MSERESESTPPGTIDVRAAAPSGSFQTANSNGASLDGGGSTTNGMNAVGGSADNDSDSAQAHPAPRSRMDERYQLRGPRRRIMIILGISATAIISALAVALLYSKWAGSEDYSATIIVYGEEAWDGAIVTVKGSGLPPQGLSAPLEKSSNLLIRFHVPPGNYFINVLKNGKPIIREHQVTGLKADQQAWPFRPPGSAPSAKPVPD